MGMRGNNEGTEMVVTVKKTDLLDILQKNRVKHQEEFDAAVVVYRRKMSERALALVNELQTFASAIKTAPWLFQPSFPDAHLHDLPRPASYIKDYDRAIGMLHLHANETMTIDMTTYRQYVEDEWAWSSVAKRTNSTYLGG